MTAATEHNSEVAPIHVLGALRSCCEDMLRLFSKIRDVARSDAAVLIQGESGAGKTVIAETLHCCSMRRAKEVVIVVCTGLSAVQLELELRGPSSTIPPVGHPTSSVHRPIGALTRARRGTIILKDVAALNPAAQDVLLRTLSMEPSLQQNPSHRGVRVRFIATTHQDLGQLVRQGRFRSDLYYRLAAARLEVPALRNRRADIALLVRELLAKAADTHNRSVPVLDAPALDLLTSYTWPGNIRQLHDVVEQALLQSRSSPHLTRTDLVGFLGAVESPPHVEIPIGWTLADAEREIILQTLAAHGGSKQLTADALKISRRTLYEKLARYAARDRREYPHERSAALSRQ